MVDQDKIQSIREKFDSNVDYTTVLDNFEGPLDLLLFLINKEEIEIKDVFVSQVTEQFLDYMKGLPYLDVDKVSEYLNIAATIIKIKAQALVPNIEEDPEIDAEIEEDKAQLIRALEEYKLIKEETKKLKELETIGYYFKEPDKDVGETRTVFTLDHLTLDGLITAFSQLMLKREEDLKEEEVREIPRDSFTVEQKIQFVLESLEELKEVKFEELFTKDYTKSEIVTTFQAILELLKYQFLRVKQENTFGEITISLNPDRDEEAGLGTIDEYD
ncbi:MAG TPA: segregation/condensation protein A [Firmicutes bacterium]|nr:segregation/condensation protein A [Bacillota bacterium]